VYDSLGEKQKALDYYNQALPLSRAVGDQRMEGTTLNNIGLVYNSLGEKQRALDYLNQALPILRAVGDRRGEATTLNNIGLVYNSLGEKQKALDYYNQSLPLIRAVGDRGVEAITFFNFASLKRSQGNLTEALTDIEATITIVEDLRTNIKGEGLVGLIRGFMYAGSRRVVVSLWSVNDAATSELMAKFYQKILQGGKNPVQALREAQLEMWNSQDRRSPYYWAAFTVQGDWR